MVNSDQQIVPFDQIRMEILTLCEGSQDGDFWLFTEKKHTAIISLRAGEIVGMRYRISRGIDALDKIRSIKKARIRFQENDARALEADMRKLPATGEILKILGVDLVDTKKKIMVVEDSSTQRRAICKMVKKQGYQVMEASNGYDALSLIDRKRPDLILLDIVMPGMDGYEVMSAIKKMKKMEGVKIIMLTSRGSLIDKTYAMTAGTDEYLTKPFKSHELMKIINKHLEVRFFSGFMYKLNSFIEHIPHVKN